MSAFDKHVEQLVNGEEPEHDFPKNESSWEELFNFGEKRIAEIVALKIALAAEKTAHGLTWERLMNVENVAWVMAEAIRVHNTSRTNHHKLDAALVAYDKFRTAAKPEEAE